MVKIIIHVYEFVFTNYKFSAGLSSHHLDSFSSISTWREKKENRKWA